MPVEVRIVAEKKEAFQSFRPDGLDEHFAGYSLSFDAEIIDEPVNGTHHVAVHHLVASRLLDVASDAHGWGTSFDSRRALFQIRSADLQQITPADLSPRCACPS